MNKKTAFIVGAKLYGKVDCATGNNGINVSLAESVLLVGNA